jgi:hypothetical protein
LNSKFLETRLLIKKHVPLSLNNKNFQNFNKSNQPINSKSMQALLRFFFIQWEVFPQEVLYAQQKSKRLGVGKLLDYWAVLFQLVSSIAAYLTVPGFAKS